MEKKKHISDIFPKYLFWDMDISSLDLQADSDIIIPRALYMTNKETFDDDIMRLEKLYTQNQIAEHLRSTKELISNEICKLVAQRYSIPLFYRFSRK